MIGSNGPSVPDMSQRGGVNQTETLGASPELIDLPDDSKSSSNHAKMQLEPKVTISGGGVSQNLIAFTKSTTLPASTNLYLG